MAGRLAAITLVLLVSVDVEFESLTARPYRLYAIYDPGLSNGGDDNMETIHAKECR